MALYHIHLYIYFCLLEVDLEKGQSALRPSYSTDFKKSLDIFNLCTYSIIKRNFTLAHETIYVLW